MALVIKAYVMNGNVVIEYYARDNLYDGVVIRPSVPAVNAFIVVAPVDMQGKILRYWVYPLSADFVVTGLNMTAPLAVVRGGRAELKLFFNVSGVWMPPPTATNWGSVPLILGGVGATVKSPEPGTAVVEAGNLSTPSFLWSGTVVMTPLGVYTVNSTLLGDVVREVIDLGNKTRLASPVVYVNGVPWDLTREVPLGSLVYVNYKREYWVEISSPPNKTSGWFPAGSVITVAAPPVVDFDNGTRLVEPRAGGRQPPMSIAVDRPLEIVITYKRQHHLSVKSPVNSTETWVDEGATVYISSPQVVDLGNGTRLVKLTAGGRPVPLALTVTSPIAMEVEYTRRYRVVVKDINTTRELWIDAGASYAPNAASRVANGVSLSPVAMEINGAVKPLGPVAIERPTEIRVIYNASTSVPLSTAGLPALYATATLKCGEKTATASGWLVPELRLTYSRRRKKRRQSMLFSKRRPVRPNMSKLPPYG